MQELCFENGGDYKWVAKRKKEGKAKSNLRSFSWGDTIPTPLLRNAKESALAFVYRLRF